MMKVKVEFQEKRYLPLLTDVVLNLNHTSGRSPFVNPFRVTKEVY